MLNRNAFGKLVQSYREQRGWTQDELAARWGYTRAYVSKRHLGWVEKTYHRLRVLPTGKEKKLDTLGDAIVEAKKR